MWFFKKGKEKKDEAAKSSVSDKVAGKIASVGIRIQTKITENMNKLFSNMPVKKLKTILIVFCLGCGGYSIYLVANAIFSSDKKQPSFKVDQVDVPKHFDRAGDEMIQLESYVDEETYLQIEGFKQYMDSLQINKSNRYDSIMIARPGLMDSVIVLEEIYNSQKLK
ncbi:MAG: hypothetical protein ABI675_18025 [Chitinophagaceae bacterium]